MRGGRKSGIPNALRRWSGTRDVLPPVRAGEGTPEKVEVVMLKLAIVFLLVGIVAALLGFTGIAGASFAIAKIFAFIFLVLFLVFLLIGVSVARRI